MDFLSRIYEEIQKDEIASFFVVWIAVWLILAVVAVLFCRFFPFSWQKRINSFIEITPNSLATLGILGTFTGILIGLLDFDVRKIDESVPNLLKGLKVAFITSIVGIAAAVFFRIVRLVQPSRDVEIGITPEDIHATLVEIRNEGRVHAEDFTEQFTQLRQAISSDTDSSLLTQIQKLRTTIQDGQNELTGEFRKFAETMVENNQKALIEALGEVIRDFNTNLTEQFGDNFRQLNEAVRSLVTWQEQYRQQVEAHGKLMETAVSSIKATQGAMETIRNHSERIPESIKPLEDVLIGINAQTETLDAYLRAFADLREKAVEAFPIIKANLEEVTTQLTAIVEKMGSELSKAMAQHTELIDESAEKAQQSLQQTVDRINELFTSFDEEMQKEVKRLLQLFGESFASISEKLVSDWREFTELIQNLQEELENIRGGRQ